MTSHRKTCWTDADVRCPFYISDERSTCSIRCEGYDKGVDAISRFRSLGLREKHMGRYCAAQFERCPVYRCTYGCKYAD